MDRKLRLLVFVAVTGCGAANGSGLTDGGSKRPDGAIETRDGESDDEPSEDAGGPACKAIVEIPPLFSIDTSTGSPVCDPSFEILDWPDATPPTEEGGAPLRCPGWEGCPAGDAGCNYVLVGLQGYAAGPGGPYTVQVSEPGFAPAIVSGVKSGVGGCVPTVEASHIEVTLTPRPQDAGADGD